VDKKTRVESTVRCISIIRLLPSTACSNDHHSLRLVTHIEFISRRTEISPADKTPLVAGIKHDYNPA
jgi:hypothetical protein